MTIREMIEDNEKKILCKRAKLSCESQGRVKKEEKCSLRTVFMRDRDRIIHSEAFRRMKHKTQVFFSPLNDLFRTRLTHTLEVAQISRTIAKALKLNEDLTEAIALGHDIGHAPFGHTGERILAELNPSGFSHARQSFRIVDKIEKGGLNLTKEVRDGILKHSKGGGSIIAEDTKRLPMTLEGEIVRISDRIAYLNHDIDDAIRAKLLKTEDIPSWIISKLGITHSGRINTMVEDTIKTSVDTKHISISPEIVFALDELKDFLYNNVYRHPMLVDEGNKTRKVVEDLFAYFLKDTDFTREKLSHVDYPKDIRPERIVTDYISMMTDDFAIMCYEKYILPKKWFVYEDDRYKKNK